jgi:hypothetical protein
VSKAIEARRTSFPILQDADNWHHPQWESSRGQPAGGDAERGFNRNALYSGDYHADKGAFYTVEQRGEFWEDIVRLGGGLGAGP